MELFDRSDLVGIVGSFGAQSTLLFAAPELPLAQPWNCVIGNLVSSIIGVSCRNCFGVDFFSAAFGTALAISFMLLTRSLHPPGGATALIAIIGSKKVVDLGYSYSFVNNY